MCLHLCRIDAEQGFVQPKLEAIVFIPPLPPDCHCLSGKVVRLRRSLFGLRQASRTWQAHQAKGIKARGFKQSGADACVMRLMANGAVSMVVVVHVDDNIAIGRKSRCNNFGEDLNDYVPIFNLGWKLSYISAYTGPPRVLT